MTTTPIQRRNELLKTITNNKELKKEFLKEVSRRGIVSATGWYNRYDEWDDSNAEVHLRMGAILAILEYFKEEKGITREWLGNQRKLFGLSRRSDRRFDITIIVHHYPEASSYFPDKEIPLSLILMMAVRDAYDTYKGKSSKRHEVRLQRRHPYAGSHETYVVPGGPGGGNKGREEKDAIDIRAEEKVLNFTNDDDVFGPAITRIVLHFWKVFGPRATTLWIYNKVFFEGKYKEMLERVMPEDLEDFSTFKRTLIRKLPEMDKELERLADDPEIKKAYEDWIEG